MGRCTHLGYFLKSEDRMCAEGQARDNRLVCSHTWQRTCLEHFAQRTSVPSATRQRLYKVRRSIQGILFSIHSAETRVRFGLLWKTRMALYQSIGRIERKSLSTVPMNQSYSLGRLFKLTAKPISNI